MMGKAPWLLAPCFFLGLGTDDVQREKLMMKTRHLFLLAMVSLSVLGSVNQVEALEVQAGTIRVNTPGPTRPYRRPIPAKYPPRSWPASPAAAHQQLEMYCFSKNGRAVQSLRQTTSTNHQTSNRRVWIYQDCQ